MALALDLADPGVLTVQLIRHGRELPPALEAAIVASREPAVVTALIEILRNEALIDEDGPGAGWAPIHAARLLCARRDEAAIVPLLATMVTAGDPDELLANEIERRLPQVGAPVLEPALRAIDELGTDLDIRDRLVSVLSRLGVQDERVYSILIEDLGRAPARLAGCLGAYGDPRAVEALTRLLDDEDAFVDAAAAIEKLGGTLTPEQKTLLDDVRDFSLDVAPAPAVRPPRPGRNEPCWCGSQRKYKKCHLAEDEAGGRG